MDSMTFLERAGKSKLQPLYVLHGDEPFLKLQVLNALRPLVLGPDDDGLALSRFSGDKAVWAAVLDELDTLPFLSPRRLVVIDNADPFVSRERARLEKFVTTIEERAKTSTGVLVLDVGTWPANTKLAKMVPEAMTLVCKGPSAQ